MQKIRLFAVLITVIMITGCSDKQPLSGKVTFLDDGSPLTSGTVIFDDGSHIARGDIQPDGTYVVGFQGVKDGIPKGEYSVYIQAIKVEMTTRPDQDGDGRDEVVDMRETPLIHQKHMDRSTSGWKITIPSSSKTLDLEVERP